MESYDEDMPELEDLSEEMSKIKEKKGNINRDENSKININIKQDINDNKQENTSQIQINKNNQSQPTQPDSGGFKFKKGFFLQNRSQSTEEKPKSSQPVDLTHIKSTQKQENETIKEINKEIKLESAKSSHPLSDIINKKDEWMTQDLLMKFAQKPHMLKYFMDPRFAEVIQLMQKDPKTAVEKYGYIPEFNEFIKEFSGIMAEHFEKLGQGKSNNQSIDKEVDEILKDPKIIPIIYKLQSEGKLDIELIQKDEYISKKINILIDKGYLKLQNL
jgi:hypothetical protein